MTKLSAIIAGALMLAAGTFATETSTNSVPQKKWTSAPWSDPNFFPIAVWLQAPENAERYRKAGINTYVGLWEGPTEAQLSALKKAGIHVICAQNKASLTHLNDPTIIGWMHDDEPDNAQALGARLGWGSPVAPEKVVADYQRMHTADPTRPIMLNLGQAVAWDSWYGRGSRNRHPEDYSKYLKGCDIASFDIYPMNHDSSEVAGKLWLVPYGVRRLIQWSPADNLVWNCLECTAIETPKRKPAPNQVRAEAWMSIIHGSRGLIYFVHQFKPVFREAAVFDDPEMLAAITTLNRQITGLAPVLNSRTITNRVTVSSQKPNVPIATLVKQHEGAMYLFAAGMRDDTTTATFTFKGLDSGTLEVLGENRTLPLANATFKDDFAPWTVHLYRIKAAN